MLGIRLTDNDVFDVPLILTDPYGHFKPGANGFPRLVLPGNVLVEGNPAANGGQGHHDPRKRVPYRPCIPQRHRAQRGADARRT